MIRRPAAPQEIRPAVRGWYCECGCGKPGHDMHHALIGRKKRFKRYLDREENLVLVNHFEHISRKFDTLDWRKKFWEKQVKRFGRERMTAWIESLPEKLKHRLDFMEQS